MSKFSKGQVKVIRGSNITRSLEPLFNVFEREAKENEIETEECSYLSVHSLNWIQVSHLGGENPTTWAIIVIQSLQWQEARISRWKQELYPDSPIGDTGSLTAIGTQFLYFFSVHLSPALSPLSPLFTSPYSVFLCFSLSLSFPPLSGPIHCDQGMKQQYKIQAFHRNHAFKVKAWKFSFLFAFF